MKESSTAKEVVFGAAVIVLVLAGIAGLAFYGNGLGYLVNKTFMPLNEQVRHNTFECSASHSDGVAHEIRQYQDQYSKTDADGRILIRQRVIQDAEEYTCGDLPKDVKDFVNSIR